ncbi:hypothetical protein LTR36_008160 [Oleoguttula mirabilis]|uniref:Dol-P-Glc:Glc(2)Man(9)GlcNAc(2)-PP-Dol alpha-1,2-glucosyltransferase n=1 Tax=Oleoguttula mirabilis TaxID=1507867 RepID=A0AAV9J829_9PEZI|nr:hypothetical protein LTR36_008160 [Oleoguttula mirabilis]
MAVAIGALLPPLTSWLLAVNRTIPEPYLDEVFHVRQAQQYCNGNFHDWDPKITTPPLLYLLSYAVSRKDFLRDRFGIDLGLPLLGCDIFALRAINAIGLVLLAVLLVRLYSNRHPAAYKAHHLLFQHSALNIVLFPPLFFFSALYYTDVWSTFFVVLFYVQLVEGHHTGILGFLKLLAIGLASLACRQTNIFWVAIFPAGIALVQEIDNGHAAVKDSIHREVQGFGDGVYSVAKTSWKYEVVYDPPAKDAWVIAYLLTFVSIVGCALKTVSQPKRLLGLTVALAPYLTLLAIFAAFVLWNGSVVLGDKSNHIATFHLPQMLYLWPFLSFFSLPIFSPYILLLPVTLLAELASLGSLESMQIFRRRRLLPRVWLVVIFLGIACMTVLGGTAVHPFTLADNRHYMFYVFRLLMRPWWMRYAVTPIYFTCAWSCMQTLGSGPAAERQAPGSLPDGEHSATISFVLVWVATSALQLVTAPLVEPRYFILPWIFWRMHLPLQQPPSTPHEEKKAGPESWSSFWKTYDHRLWLETVWLLAINAVTGYIFLNWGFAWPQEPGKVQRFMW